MEMQSVVELARKAGLKILEVYGRDDFGVRLKSDDSPLTEADLAAHHEIVEGLTQLDSSIPVLSEEATGIRWQERRQWARYWLVDPLDGTREFIKRNGEFTVNIALVEDHQPVLGVVYAPVLDVTYYGDDGGAFKLEGSAIEDAVAVKVKPHQPGEIWKVVGSRSHAGDSLVSFLGALGEHQMVSMGSSLKLCLVAEGAAHIYPRLGPTSEWDTAAAHAVVTAAGGEVVIANSGEPLQYNTKESLLNPFFIARPRSFD
ncbi:MAG: 3'(2'),5'-bisphosphate nucleotidase [Acidiferrobacteraceae bacterium]|jgi:3'(2'), 5'-bisphosphate nucleotidase|nr:3'(2'),5'-bisphosphate nucleotidase [Acidiferrobacteraceae bacterium]MDP6724764.1 3'(2'),5'-bisphosphate nucleotidase CysQ [Arenicellales bacterium]|tara:strand:+ start:7213 stop:7986 length:774 start_codon:yes stop_codon:yes gene_type:complete